MKRRYWNSVSNAKTYLGADADSDHNPVVIVIRMKLKKVLKEKRRESLHMERLKDDTTVSEYLRQSNLNMESAAPDDAMNISVRWTRLKEIVTRTARETLGNVKRKDNKKPWITAEMIDKMEERRTWKSVNTEEGQKKYKTLNNQLRRQTDKARQKWWEEQCQELEELDKKGLMDQLYRKVKKLTKNEKKKIQQTSIHDKNGNKLTNPTEVCSRWKEYIEELYDKENKPSEDKMKMEKK